MRLPRSRLSQRQDDGSRHPYVGMARRNQKSLSRPHDSLQRALSRTPASSRSRAALAIDSRGLPRPSPGDRSMLLAVPIGGEFRPLLGPPRRPQGPFSRIRGSPLSRRRRSRMRRRRAPCRHSQHTLASNQNGTHRKIRQIWDPYFEVIGPNRKFGGHTSPVSIISTRHATDASDFRSIEPGKACFQHNAAFRSHAFTTHHGRGRGALWASGAPLETLQPLGRVVGESAKPIRLWRRLRRFLGGGRSLNVVCSWGASRRNQAKSGPAGWNVCC